MPDFKKLTLNDIEKTRDYFLFSTNKTCDNTVGGTFMWRDYFDAEYAELNKTLIFKVKIKYHGGMTAFTIPLGKEVNTGIKAVENYCRENKLPLIFCTVTREEIQQIKKMYRYRNVMLFQETNWSDYLYHASDLVTLAGRKYCGQRNHMNFFKKTYESFSFEEISEKNLTEVRDFFSDLSLTKNKDSEFFIEERVKTFEVLDNYKTYGMLGGLIRIDGKVVAFSAGEICNDVLHVHIEKADIRYRGLYQIINNEFAKHYTNEDIKFINREEDVGDEGLRKSKESYHPCEIIDKFIVEVM